LHGDVVGDIVRRYASRQREEQSKNGGRDTHQACLVAYSIALSQCESLARIVASEKSRIWLG